MKRYFARGALLTASLLLAAPALAWAPSPLVQRQLTKGQAWAEVLPDTAGAAVIHAAIDISAPPKTVWSIMTDCRMAVKLVTTVTSCKVVQGDPKIGWDVREQVTKGNFFMPGIRNVFRSDYQPYSVIRFRKVGGDLKAEDGEWVLQPLNGGSGTRVIYVNRVAADIPLPAGMVRAAMRRDTPKVMVNLRRESLAAAKRTS
ncbi:MAG TPA: SRPBCC family protein [Caulobacteraceae bacterium]